MCVLHERALAIACDCYLFTPEGILTSAFQVISFCTKLFMNVMVGLFANHSLDDNQMW